MKVQLRRAHEVASTRPACETPEIQGMGLTMTAGGKLQRGRRARRRRSSATARVPVKPFWLQRGRRARRRRSYSSIAATQSSSCFNEAGVRDAGDPRLARRSPRAGCGLQRGRRARRRRSGQRAREEHVVSELQRGRRARRRRSPSRRMMRCGTCSLQRGRRARRRRSDYLRGSRRRCGRFNEAGVRDAGDRSVASVMLSVICTLQRGRRARRRRSLETLSETSTVSELQRGRRARRRRSS